MSGLIDILKSQLNKSKQPDVVRSSAETIIQQDLVKLLDSQRKKENKLKDNTTPNYLGIKSRVLG